MHSIVVILAILISWAFLMFSYYLGYGHGYRDGERDTENTVKCVVEGLRKEGERHRSLCEQAAATFNSGDTL